MIEVTEADKKLLQDWAINIREGGSRHDREQLVATHREAAAKAERDRLQGLPIGAWLSAALDDPAVCEEMKADIRQWFDALESQHD